MKLKLPAVVIALSYLAFAGQIAIAAEQDEFFRGKIVKLMIGTGPGASGYDTYGRLVARHLGQHLPGNPTVVPQNMPGASSLLLTNYLFNSAPRDGTVVGIVNQSMPIEQFLKSPNTNYDVTQFNWIGRVSSATELAIVWHTAPVNSINEVFPREILMGGTGPTSETEFVPHLLNNLAGTKFRVVSGFNGAADVDIALERGEVDGSATMLESLASYHAEWVRDKKIKILLQYTRERDPGAADIPTMVELGKTAEAREILGLYANSASVGRSFVAPPGLPAERVAMLRTAFNDMLVDPQFLEDAKTLGIQPHPLTGVQLQELILNISKFPSALIPKAQQARMMAQ